MHQSHPCHGSPPMNADTLNGLCLGVLEYRSVALSVVVRETLPPRKKNCFSAIGCHIASAAPCSLSSFGCSYFMDCAVGRTRLGFTLHNNDVDNNNSFATWSCIFFAAAGTFTFFVKGEIELTFPDSSVAEISFWKIALVHLVDDCR